MIIPFTTTLSQVKSLSLSLSLSLSPSHCLLFQEFKHSPFHCFLFQAFFIPLPFVCKSDPSILDSIALMFQVSFWHSSFHWYCGSQGEVQPLNIASNSELLALFIEDFFCLSVVLKLEFTVVRSLLVDGATIHRGKIVYIALSSIVP
jgi:hypothetical protein